MKHLKIKTGLITGIFATAIIACQKENVQPETSPVKPATIIETRPNNIVFDRVGEEEEEEIIQGRLIDEYQTKVEDAAVFLVTGSDSTTTDSDRTDANGNFEVSGQAGEYLFRINIGNMPAIYTAPFKLEEDVMITVQL